MAKSAHPEPGRLTVSAVDGAGRCEGSRWQRVLSDLCRPGGAAGGRAGKSAEWYDDLTNSERRQHDPLHDPVRRVHRPRGGTGRVTLRCTTATRMVE